MAFADAYRGRRVLVTGHTGFKGAWLCRWLIDLGAEVHGFALAPEPGHGAPGLFEDLGLAERVHHVIGDVRDAGALDTQVRRARPHVVFHLAAQPLVRLSYREPAETFDVNVMGAVHLLESLRRAGERCAVVVVTTDKCYENTGRVHGYREDDPMGGHDPYSASKGCAELVVASYRRSFFAPGSPVALASARAGNVIGGGDFAEDRIVPDCVRMLAAGRPIPVRSPDATRPWQHVLEPLSGYLMLGERLLRSDVDPRFASAFNFGPPLSSNLPVRGLVESVLGLWPGSWTDGSDPAAPHEAERLHLATDKAFHLLGWSPAWSFEETIARTVGWYRSRLRLEAEAEELCAADFEAYRSSAKAAGLAWAS